MVEAVRTLIILGADGDLTSRLLLPALGQLLTRDDKRRVTLLGAGMHEWDAGKWRSVVEESFASVDANGPAVDALLKGTDFVSGDVTDGEHLKELLARADGTPALYLALPPAVTKEACAALADLELPHGLRTREVSPGGLLRSA